MNSEYIVSLSYVMMIISHKYYSFNIYFKRIIFGFFLFPITIVNAKDKDNIDMMLEVSKQEFFNLNYTASIKSSHKVLELSEKKMYSKGITLSSIAIAKALAEIGIYEKALNYLAIAEKEPFFLEYINAQVETYRLRGRIYGNLKMYKLSNLEFYKQLKFSHKLKDPILKKRAMFWAHQNLAQSFSNTSQHDSVWSHLIIQKKIIESLPKGSLSETYYEFSSTYAAFAKEYIRRGNYVAARNNLDQSMAILKSNNSTYLHHVFKIYGDLEDALGNTLKAEMYYKLALTNAIQLKNKAAEEVALKILSDYFLEKKLNDVEGNDYILRHRKLSDSLNDINKNVTNLVLNQVLKTKNDELKNKTNNYWVGFSIFGILSFCVFIFLWKSNNLKKIKLQSFEQQLDNKEIFHTDFVKQNDQNKFKDLIELGKTNNSQFIVMFKELYPDFKGKLRKLDPKIKTSEISFCAMIYLNFSTKEISEYTFVTIRAVQIRKNRLRKKYNIGSEEDLSIWMRNL